MLVNVNTDEGDRVVLVSGNCCLGNWDPAASECEFRTSDDQYPLWWCDITLPSELQEPLEYTYAIIKRDGSILWEDGNNRQFTWERASNHLLADGGFDHEESLENQPHHMRKKHQDYCNSHPKERPAWETAGVSQAFAGAFRAEVNAAVEKSLRKIVEDDDGSSTGYLWGATVVKQETFKTAVHAIDDQLQTMSAGLASLKEEFHKEVSEGLASLKAETRYLRRAMNDLQERLSASDTNRQIQELHTCIVQSLAASGKQDYEKQVDEKGSGHVFFADDILSRLLNASVQ